MRAESIKTREASFASAMLGVGDVVRWRAYRRIEKRWGDWSSAEIDAGAAPDPYEIIERSGNLLMYGGASCLWQCLIGNGTGTADQTLTYFNNARAAIGVGGGAGATTAAAATQTDLQGASKLRRAMEATYPTHSDGTGSGAATITFRSLFATGDANWQWDEWGVFNSATLATGRMLNRKVENLGTKTSAASWTFTITLTLA